MPLAKLETETKELIVTDAWLREQSAGQCLETSTLDQCVEPIPQTSYQNVEKDSVALEVAQTLAFGLFCIGTLGVFCATGCAPYEDHEPYDYPEGEDGTDPDNSDTCEPEICDGYLDPNSIEEGDLGETGYCVSFQDQMINSGFSSSASHLGLEIFDINGDGLLDIYLLNQGAANEIFIQQEDGQFEKRTDLGLGISNDSTAAIQFDFDNDGDQDLFISGLLGTVVLENQGNGFSEFLGFTSYDSAKAISVLQGGLVLLGTENGLQIYQYNSSNQSFDEVSPWSLGLQDSGEANAITQVDYNQDGLTDIAIANETGPDRLFLNNGDGTWSSVETETDFLTQSNRPSMAQSQITLPNGSSGVLTAIWQGTNAFHIFDDGTGEFEDVAGNLGLQSQGQTVTVDWATQGAYYLVALGNFQNTDELVLLQSTDGETLTLVDEISLWTDINGFSETTATRLQDMNEDGLPDLLTVTADGEEGFLVNTSQRIQTSCHDGS